MPALSSVFLDFNLPNATTWFFFSFLLAMALFLKFSRLLSVRNLDVVLVFVLAPGLLIVQATRPQPTPIDKQPAVQIASLIGHGALADSPGPVAAEVAQFTQQCGPALENARWLWIGYLWVQISSIYFFCRCLFDLVLVQRPALTSNLQVEGLGFLAGALLICLLAVAYRQVERHIPTASNNVPTLSNGSTTVTTPPTPSLTPDHQVTFAVSILWSDWPAWAVAALAFACHVVVVLALVAIAWRHFQDPAAGMAAATFYLLLPYTGFLVGQTAHVLPIALFLGVLLAYRLPMLAGALLGIATAATYFPLFVLPLWLSFYRERGAGRFLAAFIAALALGLGLIGTTLWLNGQLGESLQTAIDYAGWLPWREPTTEGFWMGVQGFWMGVHWAYRIPVFLVFLSFVIATMFWPTPKNLAQVIALSTAIFISLQWWGADQGGVFVLWYLPLLLLLVFRPNLQDRVAVPIVAETDWLTRSMGWCARMIRRVLKIPAPVEKMEAM
jgi:hypothetical protein